MTPISIGILAVSMSLDAFIASLGKGTRSDQRPGVGMALRTGLLFGVIEALTPLIGWTIGLAASHSLAEVDHWLAFAILSAVGVHMILGALRVPSEADAAPGVLRRFLHLGPRWALLATAIGTSIDAMAVGVSLAFIEVNIFAVALAIGFATTVMSAIGILAGRLIGKRLGRMAEALGGLALIGLGVFVLFEHLAA